MEKVNELKASLVPNYEKETYMDLTLLDYSQLNFIKYLIMKEKNNIKVMAKRNLLIMVLLICPLVFVILFPHLYEEFKSTASKRTIESLISKCPLPEKKGINICCYEDDNVFLCNNKSTFRCGEKIEVRIRLDEMDVPFYVCFNQTFHPPTPIIPTDWTVLYPDALFTCSEDPKPDPDILAPVVHLPADFLLSGIIYNTSGTQKLIEVRVFPFKNYTALPDLLEDLENSKIVLEVEKKIIC